jgi:hypothetical protein
MVVVPAIGTVFTNFQALGSEEYHLNKYKLNFKVQLICQTNYNASYPNNFQITDHHFRKMIPFQILVDDEEIFSNRPYYSDNFFKFEIISHSNPLQQHPYFHLFDLKIEKEFFIKKAGVLKFRILKQIRYDEFAFVVMTEAVIKELKINYVKEKFLKEIKGKRVIDFTTKFDIETKYSSIADTSVNENIKIKKCLNSEAFEKTLPIEIDSLNIKAWTKSQYVKPYGIQEISLRGNKISKEVFGKMFLSRLEKNIFLENQTDLTRKYFKNILATMKLVNSSIQGDIDDYIPNFYSYDFYEKQFYLAWIASHDEYAVVPDNLELFNDYLIGYLVKCIEFDYVQENVANRGKWKIYGTTKVQEHRKAYIDLLMGMRSKPTISISYDALDLIFPDSILTFRYNNQNVSLSAINYSLDLTEGKTTVELFENNFEPITDITYE